MFGNLGEVNEDEIYTKYRLITLKSLKRLGLEILQSTYAIEKTDVFRYIESNRE